MPEIDRSVKDERQSYFVAISFVAAICLEPFAAFSFVRLSPSEQLHSAEHAKAPNAKGPRMRKIAKDPFAKGPRMRKLPKAKDPRMRKIAKARFAKDPRTR